SDQTIAHHLVTQKGFNPSGAETFIKTFKGTLKHAQLKKSDIMSTNQTTPPAQVTGTTPAATPAMTQKSFKQDVYHFADGGQVILQWPEGMSPESFDE